MRRFNEIRKLRANKKRYYINTILPPIPLSQDDIYIVTQDGDRLDNLSYEFYNDTQFWWVIAAANPNKVILSSSVNMSAWSIVTDTTQVKAAPAIKYSWVDLIGAKEQLSYL